MEIEMKRVINGVEYEAVETANVCKGCAGYDSIRLCKKLRDDCHYKIWIKVDTEETQNKACNMNQTDKILKPHKHAEAMKLYAEDAATTDKPWELWEYHYGTYGDEEDWRDLENNPKWNSNYNYRRKAVKPKTININGYEVPEPLQNAPKGGTMYWYPNTSDTHVSCSHYYSGYQYHVDRLVNGLVHMTEEAAQKHLEALLSFTRKGK